MELSMRRKGYLFPEPDMEARIAGCARHWPDGRGVYASRDLGFFVWCNEEDHVAESGRLKAERSCVR